MESAGYFRTLRVPLVRGREFRTQDDAGASPVVMINEAMARRYWPRQDPIGKWLKIDLLREPRRQIVGIVGDLRHNRYDREAQPQMYVPFVQQPLVSERRWLDSRLTTTFVARAGSDPMRLVSALRAAVTEVDRGLPIYNIKTLDSYVADQLWQPKQTMILLAIFGTIAVMLAMTGVYGIMAHAVRQRTREIGIRMALGANARHVQWLVIARGLLLTALGLAIGVPSSLAVMRVLESSLWGVTPADPLTYGLVSISVIIAATLACYRPARHASEIDPSVALRCE